jgi:hypothetical protein
LFLNIYLPNEIVFIYHVQYNVLKYVYNGLHAPSLVLEETQESLAKPLSPCQLP